MAYATEPMAQWGQLSGLGMIAGWWPHAWRQRNKISSEKGTLAAKSRQSVLAARSVPVCRRNNQLVVKIGDKEVDVSSEFRLFLTTKLPNPNYAPEVSTKAMIVNFAVKMSGLEAQLRDTVVKHERPDLAKQKSDLVVKVRPRNQSLQVVTATNSCEHAGGHERGVTSCAGRIFPPSSQPA